MGSKAAAAAPSKALIKALRLQLEASLLPGDAGADKAVLDEAATWLLASAATRQTGEPILQLESTSGARRHLRIAIINDDQPFLVDSLAATIAAQGVGIDRLLHPVVPVERDADGVITGLGKTGARESLIYIETPRVDARQRRELLEELQTTLGDVHAAVADWPAMQDAMAMPPPSPRSTPRQAPCWLG